MLTNARGADSTVGQRLGVERASATLRNVSGAWIEEQRVEVTDGAISRHDVVLEITFVLED